MTKKHETHLPTDRITLDDLFGDLFELNIQGLRSVRTLFVNPRRYFAAAETPDWEGRFTPSMRLWLSVVAILFFFQFIWASEGTPLVTIFAMQLEQGGIVPPDGMTYADLGMEAARWVYGIMPFTMLFSFIVFAAIYPLWGRATTIAFRERMVFAVTVPSSVVGIFTTLSVIALPVEALLVYGAFTGIVTMLVDMITAYRGAFPDQTGWGRFWRALLLGMSLFTVNIFASLSAQVMGGIIAGYMHAGG